MPWRIKKLLWLIIIAFAMLGLAIVVWVRNEDVSADLLAVIGILGAIAVVITNLPENGKDDDKK